MKEISKLDYLLLTLGFLIVAGIFTLAIIMKTKGVECAINPINYAIKNNITLFYPKL